MTTFKSSLYCQKFTSSREKSNNQEMSDNVGVGGEVYEVEKILQKRIMKGKAEYLIKWKGSKIQLAVIIDYRHLL